MNQQFYFGCVENRNDPLKLGRTQVRVVGLHTEDKALLPTEKLPWAVPLQPTTSAAISGIGDAPVGYVEGSFVVVIFMDPDQQQPVILGGIGGIPQDRGIIDYSDDTIVLRNSDGDLETQPVDTTEATDESIFKPALSYSTEPTDRVVDFIKEREQLRLDAYADSGGVITIGYGTTLIDGLPVSPTLTITEAQADTYLLTAIENDAIDSVRRNTKALLTPSMFDALVSFVYNVGRGNYFRSDLRTELNANRYRECAAKFQDYNKDSAGNVLAGLSTRRLAEKTLFLQDGLPGESGEIVKNKPTPVDEIAPNGIVSPGITDDNLGFRDPKNIYPLYKNEPDTNRLARHESIQKTIVYKKEAARDRSVPSADGGSWDQSLVPYNAQYPHNNVYQSESGHVMEFDDTKDSERIHIYHKSGTFTEIDANGTQVNRIVGDGYEILERNGYVHINGKLDVSIDGDSNVMVGGAHNVEITGKTVVNIHNSVEMNVSGNMDTSVGGIYKLRAASMIFESMGLFDVTSIETLIQTGGIGINTGVFVTNKNLQFGNPGNATKTGLLPPGLIEVPNLTSFSDLIVITRGAEAALQYETPEDGDPSAYLDYQVDAGLILQEDVDSGTEAATETPPENNIKSVDTSCDVIFGMEEFPSSLQLSTTFTLGALTKNGTRKLINQFGLTKQEICCNLKQLCVNVLEPIYSRYPNMIITSGFRRPGDVINSSPTSEHYLGQAGDITLNGFNREQHYEAAKVIQKLIPYNQLILEYSGRNTVWLHVSYKSKGNKKQVMTFRDHRRVGSIGELVLLA